VRVRQVGSGPELEAAWRLVAGVLGQNDSHPRNGAFYARHLPHRPDLLLVCDAEDGALAGAFLAPAEVDHVWIGKLAILPAHCHKSAASALLSHLEQNAAAAGHPRVMLGASREAEAFYARRGYRPTLAKRNAGAPPQRVLVKELESRR
jgi:predicted N-acetyltransferase YhbS